MFVVVVDCENVTSGDVGFCKCHSCSENEGDCDSHDECQDGLACGSNNCPASLSFDPELDCCYQPTLLGDEHYCTTGNPCGEDEGDCDYNDECQDGLFCGSSNCLASLGFDSEIDCCSTHLNVGHEDFCTIGRHSSEKRGLRSI